MAVSLQALSEMVGGNVLGDGGVLVEGAATLPDAGPNDITLVDKFDKAQQLARTNARAAVVPRGFSADSLTMPAIEVHDVHRAFAEIVTFFRPQRKLERRGVSPSAFVSPTARLADDVEVQPGATIEDDVVIGRGSTIYSGARIMAGCELGDEVSVHPNAVLYENTQVGSRSVIHAGAVIGCHGFGYKLVAGSHQPCAQLGYVEIGPDVEVGAGTTIDRGTYGPTIIGEGTKIDNLVQIAHNCHIGKHNMICSQVGIAGSSTTGDYVVMAGQVGVRDHVAIGSNAVLGAMSGVTHDVPAGAFMLGIPATPEREQKIKQASLARLPEMRRQLKELERAIEKLASRRTISNEGRRLEA